LLSPALQDPREYLPFLRALRSLPPFLQRHKIDDHLGRYSSALTNLSKAGDEHFDDALEYTKKHGLFEVALRAYEGDKEKYEVRNSLFKEARVFAHLSLFRWSCPPMRSTSLTARATSKQHFVRSMLFERVFLETYILPRAVFTLAGQPEKAMLAYQRARAWQELFTVALTSGTVDEEGLKELAADVAGALRCQAGGSTR
jgi:elongator complex protein 1